MADFSHIVNASAGHTHTIIFLHGRDSTAQEFSAELFESEASDPKTLPQAFPSIEWVFPNAGMLPLTRFSQELSQWFDMWSVEEPHLKPEVQIPGFRASVERIQRIIEVESEIVGCKNVFLCGISQGCATAIQALLNQQHRLGGFTGLSSWFPMFEAVSGFQQTKPDVRECLRQVCECNRGDNDEHVEKITTDCLRTPVFLGHFWDDKVVPVGNGKKLERRLRMLGMQWNGMYTRTEDIG